MFKNKMLQGALIGFVVAVGLAYAADGTIVTWTGKGSRRSTTEFEIRSSALGSAADLIPGTANANKLGTTSLYWKDVISARLGFGTTITVGTTVPDYAGQLGVDTAYVVYVATGTGASQWSKVGGQ